MSPRTQQLNGDAASDRDRSVTPDDAGSRRRSLGSARWLVVALATLALVLAACGGGGGGGSTSAGGKKTSKITLGVQTTVLQTYYAQLAEKLGYFKQEGLDVKVIVGEDPAASVQALIGGSLDMFLGGPEALPAAAKGADIRFIAAGSNRSLWDIVTTKDVRSIKDLKGKPFAVSSLASASTATVKQALQAQGVNPDDVKYIPAGGTKNRFTALSQGRVKGAALGIPVNYKAADSGKFNDFGGTDTTLHAPPIAATELTTTKKWADGNKDVLQRFLRAYQRVINALYDPSMTPKIVAAASSDLGVDPKYTERAIKTLFLDPSTGGKVLPKDGQIDLKALQNLADAYTSFKLLPSKVDVSKFVDMSYLKAAQASLKG